MPANTSFKVQCPSCEAQVPVRDSALIGKKIDCPKCKYRFVVDDPSDDILGEGDEAPRKGGKARPKKTAGNNNMLILGSVLGVVAVALLGVGAYFLFFNEPAKSTPPNPNPIPLAKANLNATENSAGATPGNPPTPPAPDGSNPANPTPPANPVVDVTGNTLQPGAPTPVPHNDISNLLPGDAQAVYAIHMDKMRACTLGQQAFESRVGFKPEAFKQKLGIDVSEINRFVRAESLEGNWSFNVFRTIRPVTLDELKPALGLEKADKSPIQGREYYRLAPNDLLDNLSTILHSELEVRDARNPTESENKPKTPKAGPLMLLQVDPTTFVIATQEPMEEFLQAGGKWEMKSIPTPGAGDPNSPGGTPDAAGSGEGGVVGINKGNRGGQDPPTPATPGSGPQFTSRATWLCVDPGLKKMMDRLEGDGRNVIATLAQRLQSNPKIVNRLRDATGLQGLQVQGMNVLGVVLNEFDASRFKAQIDVEMFREADAKTIEDQLKEVMPAAGQILGLYLGGLRIDVEGGSGGGGGGGPRSGPGAGDAGAVGAGNVGTGSSNPGGGSSGGPNDGPKSTLSLRRQTRILSLATDLNMTIKAYDKVYELGERIVIRMKGMVDMADTSPHWHALGAAAVAVRGKDGIVPRGTYVREDMLGGKLVRSFPPHQRVGWLVSLLPHLGHEDLYNRIDRKKSWRDDENLKQGAILVPEFLNPSFDRRTWRAGVPSLGLRDQGATHVVGIAGIGPDAADYSLNDTSVAKKIGMVGYDRRLNMKDVTDGASNTIYMIQVPPNQPRPWIAGGGASIAGAPEKDSVRPFVVTGANGKRGATVIMADGSVRFVAETVSDDVFKALCTIRGGEELVDLDKQIPKVDPPKKGAELKTASSGGASKPQQPAGELK
jgi:hypothetical protein